MVSVPWFVGALIGLSIVQYLVVSALLRSNQALSRALIANNAKDLTMLDRTEPTRSILPGRRAPERNAEFVEPTLRPMGLD